MPLRDPKCQHNRILNHCSLCKRDKVPMQGTMRNGRLVSGVAKKKPAGRKRGWG